MPRRTGWTRADVLALARTQHGLVTWAQLRELGVPRSTITYSLRVGGMFSWVLPGVHRVDGDGPLSTTQRNLASLMYAGERAALTGAEFLRGFGIKAARHPALNPHDRVHVAIPHERRKASHGFVQVERSVVPWTPWLWGGLPAVPIARAVVDAARRCTDQEAVRALTIEVVQRRLVTPQQLDAERRQAQVRGSRFLRLSIEEALGGARSVPEADLRAEFLANGWTRLLFNASLFGPGQVFIGCPDVYDPITGVCLEVDSREFHFDPASWEATMARHARFTAAGLAMLHVPPSRITRDVAGVVAEFATAVGVRRHLPSPLITVRP
jgi:hypothetical protein